MRNLGRFLYGFSGIDGTYRRIPRQSLCGHSSRHTPNRRPIASKTPKNSHFGPMGLHFGGLSARTGQLGHNQHLPRILQPVYQPVPSCPLCTEQLSPLSHALDEFGSKAINLRDLLSRQTPGFQFGCNQVRMFLTNVPQRISHGFADVLARITAQPRQP